jgi:hypothetical protein
MLVVSRKVGQRLVVAETVAAPGDQAKGWHFVHKPTFIEILSTCGEGRRAAVKIGVRPAPGVAVRPMRSR